MIADRTLFSTQIESLQAAHNLGFHVPEHHTLAQRLRMSSDLSHTGIKSVQISLMKSMV